MSHEPAARTAWPGLVLLLALGALGLLGPLLLRVDPLDQDLGAAFAPPGPAHWLGTDHLGRSVLARLVAAAPLSLGVALAASVLTAGLGTAAGLLAAGVPWAGRVLLGVADLVFAIPPLLVVMLAAGLCGGGVATVLLALAASRWPAFTRAAEPLARAALHTPAAEASRLLGFGVAYRLRHHAWPAVRPVVVSLAALGVGGNVLAVSALGFIGVGLAPPRPEWGAMVADALPFLAESPAALLAPAACLTLATLAATLLGEGWAAPGNPP